MENSLTHCVVSGLSGLGVILDEQGDQSPIIPLLAMGTSVAFAKLPDILESAINLHHRKFCHSLVVLVAIGFGVKRIYDWKPQNRSGEFRRALALCAEIGYLYHLLLDRLTPAHFLYAARYRRM